MKDYEDALPGSDDDDDQEVEYEMSIDNDDLMDAMQFVLAEGELKQKLLEQAGRMAAQDIFWWFRSPGAKIARTMRIFRKLLKAMEE